MSSDKPNDRPEGKFAEAMRKSREKRAGMQKQAEKPANVEEQSPAGEVNDSVPEPN